VVKHLENLLYLVCAERDYVQKLAPRQPVSLFAVVSKEEFQSLSPKQLEERGLLRFVERYTGCAGDGLRGCWAERMKQVVEDLEMMSADEIVKFVETRQDEMESLLEEILEMQRIYIVKEY
jgi:hypothetical protein